MRITIHEHHPPSMANTARVIVEVDHMLTADCDCDPETIRDIKEELYEVTIERMRLEVERWDEIKLRRERRDETDGHLPSGGGVLAVVVTCLWRFAIRCGTLHS